MEGAHGIDESERNKWSKWKRFNSDYFEQIGAMLAAKADKSYVDGQLEGKVSAVNGKGLSTNDYTNEEKAKVDAAATHADFAYEKLVGGGDSGNIELTSGFWNLKKTPPTWENNELYACNPSDSVACLPGDVFILTGQGNANSAEPKSRLWAFTDRNGNVTRCAEKGELHATPYEVVAQADEVRFYMSSVAYQNPTLYKEGIGGLIGRMSYVETLASGMRGDVTNLQEEIESIPVSVSKMFNIPVSLKKPNLKILDLGNSYTNGATYYLDELLNAAHITTGFSLYKCTRASSSFSTWVKIYKETDNANYTVAKLAGDNISDINVGDYSGLDNTWFVELLKKEWDIILIHQRSAYSDDYKQWTGTGSDGYLNEYLRILKTLCPQATIGFYVVHSYPSWSDSSDQPGNDSTERWQNIVDGVKWLKEEYGIDFIIPYGTAVQNLRMTSINRNDPAGTGKKDDFSADGVHLSSIGNYAAACAYFEALFAPRYNVTVLGNTYTNDNLPIPSPESESYHDGRGVPVQITAANALLAQRAAILAVNDMFNLHNPETSTYFSQNVEEAGDNDSFIPKAGDTNSYMEYNPILPTVGTSAQRNAMILKSKDVGFQFFDTSLKKPVYVAAVSADGLATWVNATGTAEAYMVTYNLTGVHLIEDKQSATANTNYSTTIEEDEGYALPSAVTVKVNGVSLIPGTGYDYDSETGEIVILSTSVNGPIVIEATGADPNAQGGGGQTPGPSHESQEPAWVFGGTLPATLSGDGKEQGSGSVEDWQLGDELPATLSE